MAELNEVERGERSVIALGGQFSQIQGFLTFRISNRMWQTPSPPLPYIPMPSELFFSPSLVQFVVSEPEHVLVVHSKKVREGTRNRSEREQPSLSPLRPVPVRSAGRPSLNTYYRQAKVSPLTGDGRCVCMHGRGTVTQGGLSKGGDRRWPLQQP